jgi:hypothetical protein
MKFEIIPLSLKQAKQFINKHHRHHKAPHRDKYRLGLASNGELIGCIMVGRPVSRLLDDGQTLEVNRCCVLTGYKNACSKLYSSAAKIAKLLGYSKIITYTLDIEHGKSLIASGWKKDGKTKGQNWSRPSREREIKSEYQTIDKTRWIRILRTENIDISFLKDQNEKTEQNQLLLFEEK